MKMHANQLAISPKTVRQLVHEQFPAWRDLSITPVDSPGTVNAIFRIGAQFAARFPLEPGDVEPTRKRLDSEARAARELAGRTRFATPQPVAIGEPGAGYPLPWSVQTWLPGVTATDQDPGGSAAFAHDLAEFIRGVRAIGTGGRAFGGRGRGGDLRSHDAWMETWAGELCNASRQTPRQPRDRRPPPGAVQNRSISLEIFPSGVDHIGSPRPSAHLLRAAARVPRPWGRTVSERR
jgi:aminoglycoside phosphotransferase (APT) family kinase protein